jgi:hypothetical protein
VSRNGNDQLLLGDQWSLPGHETIAGGNELIERQHTRQLSPSVQWCGHGNTRDKNFLDGASVDVVSRDSAHPRSPRGQFCCDMNGVRFCARWQPHSQEHRCGGVAEALIRTEQGKYSVHTVSNG